MIRIRAMIGADLPFGLHLSRQAGWNQTDADWQRALALQPDGGFVAEKDGTPVGVTTTCLFGRVAWVAMVLVEEKHRRQGIGRELMHRALAYLEGAGVTSIRLDATPLGQPLYEQLGFESQFRLARYEGILPPAKEDSLPQSQPVAERHWSELVALDESITRTDRGKLLLHLFAERPGEVRGVEHSGVWTGFLATREGANALQLGPCLGESAPLLLAEAFQRHAGRRVYLDIPTEHRAACRLAEHEGLRVQRHLVRMCRGTNVIERLDHFWTSGGPEKGWAMPWLVGPSVERVENVEHLEELLSEPSDQAVETLARLPGDLLLLGVGGKMGPTLARMARRAYELAGVKRRVIGVARFSEAGLQERLQAWGVETIRCDLLQEDALGGLPEVENVMAMFGMKFGSTGQQALTWAMNAYLPGMVCQRFRRSRIVAFSTGNVYGLTPVLQGGSVETDPLNATGEYAMSCVGRERIYEHFSRSLSIPMALLRLNYASEMRYGVLVDLAQKVQSGQPIDLRMGHLNALWQGDANAAALAAFAQVQTPPRVINLAGPELLSVRRLAEQFGQRLGRSVNFTGTESPDAILSNGQLGHGLFGYPRIGVAQMVAWVADWIKRDGNTLGKPTHFESRDGKF